jgi:glycosyltransferase involved in cell wall biosynthesis
MELIIIDGGSNESSLRIINNYKEKINYFLTEKDKGIYDAMNKGISHSTGDWLIFLNAGDTFIGNTTLEDIFRNNVSDKSFIYSPFIAIDLDGSKNNIFPSKSLTLPNLINDQIVCHQTVLVRKKVAKFYNLKYKLRADYDWIVNLIKGINGDQIFYFPSPTINYALGGKSHKEKIRNLYEINLISFKHFGPVAIFSIIPHIGKAIIKFLLNRR